jgi:hypothetical protein
VRTQWQPRKQWHPDWCGRGHRCGLGEHRSLPVVADLKNIGRIVLTRVLGRDGRERVEITGSAYLSDSEDVARKQLQSTLDGLVSVLQRASQAA